MRVRFKIFALVILCSVLAACGGRHGVKTICVVATTDVHGCIFDRDLVTQTDRPGSLAKIATLLKKERRQNRNVVYLDCGDNLQGSIEVYQDITAQYDRTSLPAQAFKLLDCDAVTFGNHDLAVSPLSYERFYDDLEEIPALGGNVCFYRYGDYLPGYTIVERDGVRIGILGLVTPKTKHSIPADRLAELSVLDPVKAAKRYVRHLREEENVDVVIGLIHSGYSDGDVYEDGTSEDCVRDMLSEVQGFDLIVYGHDHEAACFKAVDCNGDSVLLMNAGPYARNAAQATVYVDFTHGDKPEVRTRGKLTDVSDLEPDKGFLKSLSGWYDDVSAYADSVVGTITSPFECNGALWRPSTAVDYMHKMHMGFFAAQVSLAAPVSSKTFIPAGDLNMRDVFYVYQYDNTMVSVMLKGSEIKDILEYSADRYYEDLSTNPSHLLKLRGNSGSDALYPREEASGFVSAAGINYTIDVTKPYGKRVEIESMSDGNPFEPDAMYRTTINSYLYSGSGSAVLKALGFSSEQMAKRLNISSSADIRFYMITDLALAHETDRLTDPGNVSNWRLVPEQVVSGYLAKDTVNFKLFD
ncbi:MAG: bifunctional metallophosphatase/5'-nucleotidase [Bacteroidaceae bacterium]|nr:bifunctional metallophosphatase/5'-nucleotidase [Bacteroidaceae bacterium]